MCIPNTNEIRLYEAWTEYNAAGNVIHRKDSDGNEMWQEYDAAGNVIHLKDSDGWEEWTEYNADGPSTMQRAT